MINGIKLMLARSSAVLFAISTLYYAAQHGHAVACFGALLGIIATGLLLVFDS